VLPPEVGTASAQIALELGGQRVAVDLAERLAHVHVGVAALFEGGHVLGDLVVLGGFAMGTVSASILRPYLVVQAVAGIAAGLVFRIFNPGDK